MQVLKVGVCEVACRPMLQLSMQSISGTLLNLPREQVVQQGDDVIAPLDTLIGLSLCCLVRASVVKVASFLKDWGCARPPECYRSVRTWVLGFFERC